MLPPTQPHPVTLLLLAQASLYKECSHIKVCVLVLLYAMFRNTSKRGESFGISRIGSKIKGVFKSTTLEGAMLPSYGLAEGEDDLVS